MIGCVVLNYNDYKTTTDFVLRVKEMKSIDLIVVVDNYSTDDSFHQLQALESEKVHVIQSSKNGGYGYGNNVGIEYLKGKVDYILIANPDVEFEEGVVLKMVQAFDLDTAIVAPLTLQPDKTRQLPEAWMVPTLKDYFLFSSKVLNKKLRPMWYSKDYLEKGVVEVDCVQGSFFMIKEEVLPDKLYDENIFLFFEESCIGKYFKDRKLKTKLLIDETYIHNHSISINKSFGSEVQKRKITLDSFYTYFKDYYTLNPILLWFMRVYKRVIYIENYMILKTLYK